MRPGKPLLPSSAISTLIGIKTYITGDDVDGFGNDVKRSHILVGDTDVRMSIAVAGDRHHRVGDVNSGDAATRVFADKQKRDVAGTTGEINANRGVVTRKQ